MERSNQPSGPECCRGEGQAGAAQEGSGAEQPLGGAHSLSNPASKHRDAGEDDVCLTELNTDRAVSGEALADLPGSKSVAREQDTVRKRGGPAISRRTNCEGQAGRPVQRQEGPTEGMPGVGSFHSSAGQLRDGGADLGEGGDRTTQPAQATSTVRMTGQSWQTFL